MKRLYVLKIICIVLIIHDHYCTNDEASERKHFKLRKLISLANEPKISHTKTKMLEKFSNSGNVETLSNNSTISYSHWSTQWHIHKDQYPSMGVVDAWEMGYTGKGVVVAVLGDGFDINHIDLSGNFNQSLSYDFIDDELDVSYDSPIENHTTAFAGVIAAMKNELCATGIAYDVTFAVLRALKKEIGVKDGWIANAWLYQPDKVDILSHGFGIGVNLGDGFFPLTELTRSALVKIVKEGRHGKGSILVFGSGIDGELFDDCNTQGLVNSIYTIGVSPLAPDGGPAAYTEECTCVLTAAYAGDINNGTKKYLTTTSLNDTCMDNYGGASAASAVASGIIALTLQANHDLTWRDVQHLLAETSISEDIPRGNFYTNAVGRNVSYGLGFGMINAKSLVEKAPKWKGVPKMITCKSGKIHVNKCCLRNVNSTFLVANCPIQYLEHVQVNVSCKVYWREYAEIHVVSPQGTDTRILRQRKYDYESRRFSWTFMSVHTWGEDPRGNWTVRLEHFYSCRNEMHLYSWELILYGTVTNPTDGSPADGSLGGYCDESLLCGEGTNCLLSSNVCVNCSLAEHRVANNLCVKDGYDYCDDVITCQVENAWCNSNNSCETCSDGYHLFDEFCIQDGSLSGYCDELTTCIDTGAWCNPETKRCFLCPTGSRIIDGFCYGDGEFRGYCDSNIRCSSKKYPNIACDPAENRCLSCFLPNRVIDGFCREDGAIGGFCSIEIPCTDSDNSCDAESNTCISCTMRGYRSVNEYCLQDGVFHGHCDADLICTDGSGCWSESNLCVNCSSEGYRILPDGFCRKDGLFGGYCDTNISCQAFPVACDSNTSMCKTCFAGHSIIDGYCYKDELLEPDVDWNFETIIGTSVAGFIIGVGINGIIFVLTLKKPFVARTELSFSPKAK